MLDRQIVRRLGWIGVLFTALVLGTVFGTTNYQPHWNVSGESIIAHFNANHTSELVGFYLIVAALCALVFYGAALRHALKAATGQRILPNVAFAGVIVFLAGSAYSGAAQFALIEGSQRGISTGTAQTLEVSNSLVPPIAFQVGAALAAFAAGLAMIAGQRMGTKRRNFTWLGWVSIVVGILCAVHPVALLPFVIWVPVTGFIVGYAASKSSTRGTPVYPEDPDAHIHIPADTDTRALHPAE